MTTPAQVEVGHGVDVVGVWGEQRGYRFGFVLTPDEADALATRLVQQAQHARETANVCAGTSAALAVTEPRRDSPPSAWERRKAATGGGPCDTCGKPFFTHVCLSCSPDAQTPGPGCINCRNTGMDQTPCLPPEPEPRQ